MESLKELYRIGPGPSSSHTLAPQNACKLFKERYPDILSFDAELFGSLALTGEGHSTDTVIRETFAPRQCRITFNINRQERFPNGLVLRGYNEFNHLVASWTVYSLGGGAFSIEEEDELYLNKDVYPKNSMNDILEECSEKKISLSDYVFLYEKDIDKYLNEVLSQMLKTVKNGLESSGMLPGRLNVEKVAKKLYLDAQMASETEEKNKLFLMAYAYAASEENASGHVCVTAPTMGASGVIASLVYYYYHNVGISRSKLVKALALAGLFGNVVKKNATISGAVGGCQAEIGTACAMGSAMIAYLNGAKNNIIAYAAEVGMEHNLGLTCDPVGGYVIIPCIERNAMAVLRAIDSAFLAIRVGNHKQNKVSFDDVVRTMNYTGHKISTELKETSLGGLAKEVKIISEENKIETEPKETKVVEIRPFEVKMEEIPKEEVGFKKVESEEIKKEVKSEEFTQETTRIKPLSFEPVKSTYESFKQEIELSNRVDQLINEKNIVESNDTTEMKIINDTSIEDINETELEKTGDFKVSDFDLDLVTSWKKI